MEWTADKVKQLRQSSPGQSAKKDEGDGKWTAERVRQVRTATPTSSAKTTTAKTGNSQLEQAYENYRMGNNLGFAQEQGGSLVGNGLTLSAASDGSSPKGGAKSGLYANAAQALKNSYTDYSQPDAFDKANQWYDQTRNQELVKKMTETKETGGYTSYAQQGTSMGGSADPFRTGNLTKKYSTADLEKMGYSADEIAQARNYLDTMENIPEWKQATRRTANTIGGIADTVAAAPLLGAEYLGQAAKNIRQSSVNRKALAEEVAANPREKNLYDRMMETDMDYQPKYSTGDLLQQGFTRQEIEDMRSRIAGTEASESIDPEKSVGYQLYNRGQQLTGAAQSGQTDAQKAVQGVVTSAAENLAVAAVNPAAVLPVLSAQGAAEAMGKSAEQGNSAGKALAGGALKFGAGWAINSVGAADLAKTMGSDYAKDTLAGNIADWVRGLAGDSAFAKQYPAIANAISGGMDNAMQAFVETYADQAIDAALGDSEAAKTLFSKDTLLTALESGLSGGASGALGGAVGTGLAKLRGYDVGAEDVEPLSQRNGADGAGGSPSQSAQSAVSSPEGRAVGISEQSDLNKQSPAGREVQRAATEGSSETTPNRGAAFEAAQQALKNPDAAESTAFVEPETVIAANEAANAEAGVNGQAVENTGENVENPLRETYGLRGEESQEAQQGTTARTLRSWGVSETAAQEIGQKLPEGTNAERYAAAASTLYRLGQMEDVRTFDQALELAGTGSGMAANVNYVLGNATGRNALEIAYTYGRGEAESRWEQSQLGGSLTDKSLTGRGETLYEGTMRSANEAASRVIELNAAATGTTAVLKNVLQNEAGTTDSRVRAYVDTETGKIFFGDSASDVFGTVLHEDWHWYNALDSEGAKQVMDHALNYLARANGFETIDEMIRNKMTDYAGQGLTYEEAAEELVGDAWRGIFSNEEDFKRWVQFQRGQAEKNSGKAGTLHKVMNRVKEMLDGIVSRAKEILTLDPENAAARKAQRLAEKERRILQEEYFAHAEKAMDNLRAAKENAAALKHESAAEGRGIRYSLPDMVSETEIEKADRQMAMVIRPAQMNAERTARVNENEWSGLKPQEALKAIKQVLTEFGIQNKNFSIDNVDFEFRYGNNNIHESTSKQTELTPREYHDFSLVQANIEEVIRNAVPLEAHSDKKGKPHVDGMIVLASALQDGKRVIPVRAELKLYDNRPTALYFAIAETTAEESRNAANKKELDRQVRQEPLLTQEAALPSSSDLTITDFYNLVKHDANFTKYFSDEVAYQAEGVKELQKADRKLESERRTLKDERERWMNSEEVKAIEAKKKSFGLFSAEGKAYKESAEYQSYLEKRKELNRQGAELDDRIGEIGDRLRETNARLEARRRAIKKDRQLAYDTRAREAGGKAEYRRQLAVEKFGTTDAFERAGYILPDGQMLDFAQNGQTRDTDHREIMDVFGPAEVSDGTDALNAFLADGNVRVMAEAPGVDLAADKAPTAQQMEQIRNMAEMLGAEKKKFTLDISGTDGRVAAAKDYSGHIDADRIVREIREYYKTGELPAESSLARFRYQLAQKAEQADRESRKNVQRQASRAIADNSVMLETLGQMMGIARGVRISQDSIDGLALRWTKTTGSKTDRTKLAGETRALVEYLKADGADMSKAQSLAETLAGEVLDGATYRNTELWDEYPEYHELSYTVNRDGQAKAELVKRYGTWSEAVAEARRHGVKLRQEEGYRDGNPAEQYESIVNDTRAMGNMKDGAAALFRNAAKQAGVDGAASMESTEWLDVLMNVRDAIKPKTMSRFADAAEYEDAKVELAGRMIGDILNTDEMNDAQAIFDGFQKWQRNAVAAAVGEENADRALKDLRKVQKDQTRELNRRLYENRKAGSQNESVRKLTEQQKRNARAEKLLDENLEALGVDLSITNSGDMAEKLDVLKEAYEREWKAEKKRLREERQEMIDNIRLENRRLKQENMSLSYQVAGEQKRADAAEWQLIHQQNELMEWEEENQRKAQAWQEKQAQRNAIAVEVARQQRDEDIAIAKKLAEKRVEKAREGRKKDELKRAIRNNAAQLNQMVLRPAKDKYVQPRLIRQALDVARLADMTLLNQNAVNRLDALENSIRAEYGDTNHPVVTEMSNDWEQSGIANLISALKSDLTASREAKLDRLRQQLTEAEALEDSEKARALQDRLNARIKDVESKPYLPMTADQLRMLKAITSSTLHVIRTANKTLSLQQAEEVDKIAGTAAEEVNRSKGNDGKFRKALTRYNLDMLGGVRVFRMLGGYTKNGQMEKLGTMLNDGQRRQTKILVEGAHLFDDVTGKTNLKQMEKFAGKGAELVDIGLKDSHGNAVPLNHAQLCSLYMHLQNADSREHLLNGGFTVPDAAEYNRGNIEAAYQKGQTVRIGMLTDSKGNPVADTILNTIQKALTDYDRAWISDMGDFFGHYTTDLINETSMKLLGYKRAVVKNYYPIAVDRTALATQIEGLHLDATIEGRGFLKNRVKSQQPILLEECSSVVQRSLRDTAAYAGLAPAIRDVQKVLSSRIETEDGLKVLKNGILKEKWGGDAVNYVDELLTDLQTPGKKSRKSSMTALGKLRSNYAGAILTLNPGVAIAQAASLPTAGAVLGADTMAAVVPFVKNFSDKQRAALKAEIVEHGDVLLEYRLRGTQRGELESIGKNLSAAEKGLDKAPKWLTGWISGMDEITVESLWEGAKRYVERHAEELNLSAGKGSIIKDEVYWNAVNRMYQKVIEETQPNYTTMQRAGIQRNDNELVKTLTMFTTQRFQNYGILADAVMDYNAQRDRYRAEPTEESRADLKQAGEKLNRAVTSQIIQTAVFAAMKIGADFLLHRWDREQDENGDITAESLLKRYADLFMGSAAGTFLYGSEAYSFVSNVTQGKDYDVVSAPNLSAINDLGTEAMRLYKLLSTDTGEMDEEELEEYHGKLRKAALTLMEDGLEMKGLPAGNAVKLMDAAGKWGSNAAYAVTGGTYGEKLSFHSLPSSATGQYDRLFNAIQSGDSEEAKAALGKLEGMGKEEKTILSQMNTRLKKYSPEVEQAAEARNEGNDRERQNITKQLIREMYETLGIRENVKEDADKRAAVIDLVTGAIDQKADALLAGDKDRTVWSDLTDALETGKRKDVQEEIDRLRTAGKEDSAIKSKITAAVKEEYLAGNDHDRARLEKMLLALTKEGGEALYEEKTFAQWTKTSQSR